MTEKRRILYSSEASYLHTGFSKMNLETMRRLHKTNKYELAELGSYGSNADPRTQQIPWKFYGVLPLNKREGEIYQANYRYNQFGEWKFDIVMENFKPDIFIDTRDHWMTYEWMVPNHKHILDKCTPVFEICVDSEPIPRNYVALARQIPYHIAYSEYAKHIWKRDANIDVIDVIPPGVDTKVHVPMDKMVLKRNLGLPEDLYIIQMVARNQGRKRFDRVLESYQMFKKQHKDIAKGTILHFHTYQGDVGWNFVEYLHRENAVGDVLFTWLCPKCNAWWLDYSKPEPTKCRKCGENTAGTCNTGQGIPESELAKIYNLATVHVQGTICDAWNLPINESKACGVPVIGTDYSAIAEQMRNGGGIPLKVQTFFIEDRTMFKRAWFDRDDLVKHLARIIRQAKEKDPRYEQLCKDARTCAEKYDWDLMTNRWENVLDTVQIKDRNKTWLLPMKPLNTTDEAPPPNLNDSEFILWLYKNVIDNDIVAKTNNKPELDKGYNDWMNDLKNGRTREDIEKYFKYVAYQHNVKAGVIKQRNVTEILNPNDKMRIIYGMPGTAGDIVVSTAVLDGIKKKYPDASIYVATAQQYFDLLNGNPNVSGLLPYSDELFDFRKIEGCLDNRGLFDICYLPFITTQKIVSFIHGGHGAHFSKAYANYCDVALGELFVPRENFPIGIKGDYITLHVQSNQDPKNYDRFNELMEYIKLPVIQLGGQYDKEIVGTTLDLRGKLNWRQTADVIAKAKLNICIDAALGHIAAAVGTPSIVIFGGSYPSISKPMKNCTIIEPKERFGCLGACHLSKCPKPQKCINMIEPIDIAIKIKEALPEAIKKIKKEEIIFKGKFAEDEYIGAFLTYGCNYKCEFCVMQVNRENLSKCSQMPGDKWIELLNKIATENQGRPISIGGGEPTLHPDWIKIINNVGAPIRLLTNLTWDIDDAISKGLDIKHIIEVVASYHPESNIDEIITKIKKLQSHGVYVNLGTVTFPDNLNRIDNAEKIFKENEIKLRKEAFIGRIGEELHPKTETEMRASHINCEYIKYFAACGGRNKKTVMCRAKKIVIAPNGDMYGCDKLMYDGLKQYILNDYKISNGFRKCSEYGWCQPCQIPVVIIKEI